VAGFWQAVPALYNQTTKKYPLILFIHGIGELGTSISRMNCCGLPNHLYNKTFPASFKVGNGNYSFIVMAPQFKVRPSAADIQSTIDYMKARYRIDASRIYVTGLSMGGGSTWDYSAVYGQNAAAIVPVCGGTSPSDGLCQKLASKNLPIWGIYSYKDQFVPASWGTTFLNLIDRYNPAYADKTKLTIYPDVDHNHTWGRAFDPKSRVDGYNIYEWMLLYTRGGATTTPPTTPPPTTPPPVTPPPTTPPTGNTAPVARAGADQSVPKSWNWVPNLNANASTDSDGYIAKITWRQVSGPTTVSILTPNTGNSKITGLTTGSYVFRTAVTDDKGAVSYDDITYTVTNN
jgi:dienelactone hydrolase